MKRSSTARHSVSTHIPVLLAMGSLALTLVSCGEKHDAPSASGSSSAGTAAPKSEAKPISLRKFTMPDGVDQIAQRSRASLAYNAKGDVKSLFEFQRKQFLAAGWTEQPDASISDQAASATFKGAGSTISASVYSVGKPGEVSVMLQNHGEVDLAKVPKPAGTTVIYAGPLSAIYSTSASVADTKAATTKALIDAGWEPHGGVADSLYFKKGLTRLNATISIAPAQAGKTSINYGSEMLCGDFSVPPDAQDVRYIPVQQRLTFQTTADKDALVAFYKEKLGKSGWKPNHEETYIVDTRHEMVFRDPAGNVIFLKIPTGDTTPREVILTSLSAEEIADMDQKIKENAAGKK